MLNRILGRTKANDLTSEEIQQVAGAGCYTHYYDTYVCNYPPLSGNPDEGFCYGPLEVHTDSYQVCN
jgi:hypothetical protein